MEAGRSRSSQALAAALLIGLALATEAAAAPGDLDPTFSSDGRVRTAVGTGPATIAGVAVQPNGKIVAAGYTGTEDVDDIALVRYRPNGRLDCSFGGDGKVRTRMGPGSDEAHAVVLQPDGKIVVAGYVQTGSDYDVVLVRYRKNGRLDRTFGGDGKVRTSVGTYASPMPSRSNRTARSSPPERLGAPRISGSRSFGTGRTGAATGALARTGAAE